MAGEFESIKAKRALLIIVVVTMSCSYEYHQSVIDNTRAAAKASKGRPLAIALDTVRQFSASSDVFRSIS